MPGALSINRCFASFYSHDFERVTFLTPEFPKSQLSFIAPSCLGSGSKQLCLTQLCRRVAPTDFRARAPAPQQDRRSQRPDVQDDTLEQSSFLAGSWPSDERECTDFIKPVPSSRVGEYNSTSRYYYESTMGTSGTSDSEFPVDSQLYFHSNISRS